VVRTGQAVTLEVLSPPTDRSRALAVQSHTLGCDPPTVCTLRIRLSMVGRNIKWTTRRWLGDIYDSVMSE